MVQEVRKIMLSGDELVSAYDCYRRVTPGFLPEGKILSCATDAEGDVTITMQAPNGVVQEFQKKGMDVIKPMIRFCLENNIVLPLDGRKSLSINEGAATLCISLTLQIDLQDNFVPMRSSHMITLTEVLANPDHETLAVVSD